MANQIIDKALAHLGKLNLISCERVSTTVTTGATGNISLGVTNDGRTGCFGGHISGANYYVRLWVAESGVWFATVINPNTGATINNTTVALRYWVLKFTSNTKLGGVKLKVLSLVLMWHRWPHEQSVNRQGVGIFGRRFGHHKALHVLIQPYGGGYTKRHGGYARCINSERLHRDSYRAISNRQFASSRNGLCFSVIGRQYNNVAEKHKRINGTKRNVCDSSRIYEIWGSKALLIDRGCA